MFDIEAELKKTQPTEDKKKETREESDQEKMILELFDGKYIE